MFKLADFSHASQTGTQLGTVPYRSPEVILGLLAETAPFPADVWAFGCLAAETLCGEHPFMKLKGADQSGIALLLDIFHCLGTPTEDVWPGCTQLAHWSDEFPKWGAGFLLRSRASETLGEHVELGSFCLRRRSGRGCRLLHIR